MTRFEYINANLEMIKRQHEMGFIPDVVIRKYEIYCRFDYYLKQKYNRCTAALYAGDDFQVTDTWVFRIIKHMEGEI